MMRTWRTEWPQWLIIAAMFALAAIVWRGAPDSLPVHWGLSGAPDRYGGKIEALLGLPLVALGVYVLMLVLPRLDPGRANYRNFRSVYTLIRYAVLLVLATMYIITLLVGVAGWQFDVGRLVLIMVGGLLVALGSVMGKLRPNWFVGIRTPWTLSSKRSWSKTHRLGGWLFVALGALFMVGAIGTAPALRLLPLVGVGVVVLVLFVYSYVVWRSDDDRTSPAGTLPAEW